MLESIKIFILSGKMIKKNEKNMEQRKLIWIIFTIHRRMRRKPLFSDVHYLDWPFSPTIKRLAVGHFFYKKKTYASERWIFARRTPYMCSAKNFILEYTYRINFSQLLVKVIARPTKQLSN